MKVLLSARKIRMGRSVISYVQNKRRNDSVMNKLRHIGNGFEAKYPKRAREMKPSNLFEDACTLIGIC